MRPIVFAILLVSTSNVVSAADAPLVQRFLNSGELVHGEQVLLAELEANPRDDQIRFSLGFLQFIRSVERLGQTLYEYGAKSSKDMLVRLPVPENKDPAVINGYRFRRMLENFRRDLSIAESTLSGVTADDVQLRLKLDDMHLDLDADGQPTDRFRDVLQRAFWTVGWDFLKDNPGFQVNFDRGDVAWLRAYCHLMMAFLDGALVVADDPQFDVWSDQTFARPIRPFQGTQEERWKKANELWRQINYREPIRLHRFRMHMIRVAELNEESWKFIRAEKDDDREWLPNSKQTGVLRMPVRDPQIDAWLNMMAEFKLMMEGERLLPDLIEPRYKGKRLNLKLFCDDPPAQYTSEKGIPERYFTEGKEVNIQAFFIIIQLFTDPSTVGYPVWFN